MIEYNPDFKNPPWVYGPKETMDWIEATYPSKKGGKKSDKEKGRKLLKNMHIRLDLDVEQTTITPSGLFSGFLSKITMSEIVEEHFDLFSIADIMLRALAKAKFRNTVRIVVDKRILYDHPEVTSDLRKTIDLLQENSHVIKKSKTIQVTAILADIEKCTAEVKIKKVHKRKDHSIDIFMRGEIKRELYHAFLNYLSEKLGFERDSLDERIRQ
jgi:hypothetical protein